MMTDDVEKGRSSGGAIGNLVGGVVAGLYSIPEGIGYASLAGLNPMVGIYAGMIPVAVAAATTGSVLMMSTLTSAIALTMGGVLDGLDYQGDQLSRAAFTMALLAGGMMAVLGVLRLGRVVNFVSNAVMTGFVIGVALLITVGKFDEIFGYDPDYSNKVVKALAILIHPGDWDATTSVVGIGTIALAFGLKAVPALSRYALVLVVALGTAVVWIFGVDTELIRDQATILTGFDAIPIPDGAASLPDLHLLPDLLVGSISIAIVALAQGAGIRPAFPNPDGARSSASRDFLGQGLGNVVGAFFQAAPSGGSLSRTAVSADGGATGRVAGYIAAATVLVLVVALGTVVGHVPSAVIGGLLFVIGVELITGRLPDARLAWRTNSTSMALIGVTLALSVTVPLQWAILAGAVLSLGSYVIASASAGTIRRVVRDDIGWRTADEPPSLLPSDGPVVVRYTGPNFFAVVTSVAELLPAADPLHPGVLVFDVGALQHYSSTMLKELRNYHESLARAGSGLVLVGVADHSRETLARTGLLDRFGPENVLADDPYLGRALELGVLRGTELLDELRATGPTQSSEVERP